MTILPLLAPIALEHRVATVEAVVRELAQKTGQDLRMRAELKDEVLYVDLRPRPAAETLRLVARAASAEWFGDEGHTYLGRSASFWRRQTKIDAEDVAKAYVERRAPLLAPGDTIPWTENDDPIGRADAYVSHLTPALENDVSAHHAHMRALEPAGRLMSRILRALPAGEIAALPVGWSGRFAFPPTGAQRPLTGTTLASLRQYVEERRAFVAGYEGASKETQDRVGGNLMLFSLKVPTPDDPTVQLWIGRRPSGFSVTIVTRDAAHRELDRTYMNLSSLSEGEEAEFKALPGYESWKDRRISLGPAARSFVASRSRSPDPTQAALLRDPVAHEPLAAMMTDSLDALARATGDDAILAVPDEAAMLVTEEERSSLGTFAEGFSLLCTLRPEGGALVGAYRRPTDVTFQKASRSALRNLLQERERGVLRLAAIARYAAAQNPESAMTWFEAHTWEAAGFGTNLPFRLFESQGRAPIRLFGDLSPAQRETLLAGGSVTVAELGPAARQDLDLWVFARGLEQTLEDGGSSERGIAELIDAIRPSMRLVGVPGPVVPYAAFYRGSNLQSEDAQFLGHVLSSEEKGFLPSAWPDLAKERLLPGLWRHFELVFEAAPGIRGGADLIDDDVDSTAQPVSYREFPLAHRKAMEKGYGKALP